MARTPGRFLAEACDLVIGYDSPLTRPVSFSIERGEKIAVTGTNGLGKTTLLRTILGEIPPYSGTVSKGDYLFPGYFCQEAGRDSVRQPWTISGRSSHPWKTAKSVSALPNAALPMNI